MHLGCGLIQASGPGIMSLQPPTGIAAVLFIARVLEFSWAPVNVPELDSAFPGRRPLRSQSGQGNPMGHVGR
jgi:hypothetical protein